MIRLLARLFTVMILLALLLAGVRAVGGLNPASSAASYFQAEQCSPQPCWRGIQPGKTSLAQAESILNEKIERGSDIPDHRLCWPDAAIPCWNYYVRSWSADPADPIGLIAIQPARGAFKLADALKLYGDPLTSTLCWINSPGAGDLAEDIARPITVAYLTFRGNIKIVAFNPERPLALRIDMEMAVYRVYYQVGYDIFTPRWQGFSGQRSLGCDRG